VHGSGSGQVHASWTKSFLHEMADRLNVSEPEHELIGHSTKCNQDNCLTYGGHFDRLSPSVKLDKLYDTTIIFLGTSSSEGFDRRTLGFGHEAENMVKEFGKHNKANGKKTIVVMTVPGASTTMFRSEVDAILVHFYPGEMAA